MSRQYQKYHHSYKIYKILHLQKENHNTPLAKLYCTILYAYIYSKQQYIALQLYIVKQYIALQLYIFNVHMVQFNSNVQDYHNDATWKQLQYVSTNRNTTMPWRHNPSKYLHYITYEDENKKVKRTALTKINGFSVWKIKSRVPEEKKFFGQTQHL